MYATLCDNSPLIKVSTGKHEASFALNGSLMNPLEGFYATLAACAAVYAKKACKELGIAAEGIAIDCKPFAGPKGPLTLAKFKTDVRFPAHFSAEQKAAILDSIKHCAVKEVVMDGPTIDFQVAEV
ncbi:OsmC family protein [Azonexus sp. R2A61]|uniref:OsmC family protein n=1 Tax=Azonexus sp. R2A61 TaxID=2744443 RepID=UPI001F2055F5|nr:OsmC family protein [Azonexus sp. R2A61]